MRRKFYGVGAGFVLMLAASATLAADAETPENAPTRFVPIERVALKDGTAEALARQLLAARMAEMADVAGHPVELMAYLVPFNDGQQVLFASLCDAVVFGVTGCETTLYHATGPGAPFVTVWEQMIGGGPFWLDLGRTSGGLPELVSQPFTANGAYISGPLLAETGTPLN